jgi:hypothetical protein
MLVRCHVSLAPCCLGTIRSHINSISQDVPLRISQLGGFPIGHVSNPSVEEMAEERFMPGGHFAQRLDIAINDSISFDSGAPTRPSRTCSYVNT